MFQKQSPTALFIGLARSSGQRAFLGLVPANEPGDMLAVIDPITEALHVEAMRECRWRFRRRSV